MHKIFSNTRFLNTLILDPGPDAKEEVKRPEPPVKRSPSLNDSHYGSSAKARLGTDPAEVFSQLERRQTRLEAAKPSVETQTQVTAATSRSLNMTPPVTQTRGQTSGGQEPGSFTRTGSGRKLPQIPDRNRSNTLPTRKEEPEKEVEEEVKVGFNHFVHNENHICISDICNC